MELPYETMSQLNIMCYHIKSPGQETGYTLFSCGSKWPHRPPPQPSPQAISFFEKMWCTAKLLPRLQIIQKITVSKLQFSPEEKRNGWK